MNKSRFRLLGNLAVWLTVLLAGSGLRASGDLVCRLSSIAGLDAAAIAGKAIVGPPTRDPAKLQLWITAREDGSKMYVQSNYLTPGFDHPTKILADPVDLESIIDNVLFTSAEEAADGSSVARNARRHAVVHIDDAFVKSEFGADFDLDDVAAVRYKGQVAKRLTNGQAVWIAQHRPNVYLRIADSYKETFDSIASRPFDGKSLRLINLVQNTETAAAVRQHLQDLAEPARVPNLAEITTAFRATKGGVVVLLGHVEGTDYVTRNAAGTQIGRLAIADAKKAALDAGVVLLALGCKSARVSAPVAVANTFNTIDAVQRLAAARTATTWGEFFQRLSADANLFTKLDLVLDGESLATINQASTDPANSSTSIDSIALDVIVRRDGPSVLREPNAKGFVAFVAASRPVQRPPDPPLIDDRDGSLETWLPYAAGAAALVLIGLRTRKARHGN